MNKVTWNNISLLLGNSISLVIMDLFKCVDESIKIKHLK